MPPSTPHQSESLGSPRSPDHSPGPSRNWGQVLRADLRPLACFQEVGREAQRSELHSHLVTRLGSHFGFTSEDCEGVAARMRANGWTNSWTAVEASAMAWCQSVAPVAWHLGPRAPFFPQQRLHETLGELVGELRDRLLLADRRWFMEAVNALDLLLETEWQARHTWTPAAPALIQPWPLDDRTWLTCTPDLEGHPRPILLQTVEATAPQAGEALLLTRAGESPWSISVVGPAFCLEESRPEHLWTAAAMHHTGMAWSEWMPTTTP